MILNKTKYFVLFILLSYKSVAAERNSCAGDFQATKISAENFDKYQDFIEKVRNNELDTKTPDRWLLNPERSSAYPKKSFKRTIRTSAPELKENHDWLALTPGDIIYYECAFGFKEARHWGLYIGNGLVVEKWQNALDKTKGHVVLSEIINFTTNQTQIFSLVRKARKLCKCHCRSSFHREPNHFRKIYLLRDREIMGLAGFGENQPLPRNRAERINGALSKVSTHVSYSVLLDSCSHFVVSETVGSDIKGYGFYTFMLNLWHLTYFFDYKSE